MKKFLLLAFSAIFLISASSFAQNANGQKKGKAPSAEEKAEKMATDLSLSATEKASVLALFQTQEAATKQFRTETDKESPDYKTKFSELKKGQNEELKTLLGKEKYSALLKVRADERAKQEKKDE